MNLQLVTGHDQLVWDNVGILRGYLLLFPSLLIYISVAGVVVVVKAPAKSSLATVTTGSEVGREPPVLVVATVARHLLLHVLVTVGTL